MEARSARGTQMLDLHRIFGTILLQVSSEVSLRLAVRTSLTYQVFWLRCKFGLYVRYESLYFCQPLFYRIGC